RAQRTEYRGGMKARFVHAFGRHETETTHDFTAHGDAAYRVAARKTVLFGGGEQGRDDHDAGVHRPTFEGVVVILPVRRGAVTQRGRGDVEGAGMTDQRAHAGLCGCAQHGLYVVAVAY